MKTIAGAAVLEGRYHYRGHNNPHPAEYLCDVRRGIHRVLPSLDLVPVGRLCDAATLSYGKFSFLSGMEAAAVVLEAGRAGVGGFDGSLWWSEGKQVQTVLGARDGLTVWTAARLDAKRLEIQLRDARSGALLAGTELEDPLYESALYLADIPGADAVTLELAAGQDGVSVFRLSREGDGVQVRELFPKTSYTLPVWHPGGERLLSVENDEECMALYSYPDLARLALSEAPDCEDEEEWENAAPGNYHIYLQNGLALTQTKSNRIYLLRPEDMERLEELSFAGFEPRPVCELFPTLGEDTALYSTVICPERVGRLLAAGTEDETHTLLLWEEGLEGLCQDAITW